MTYQVRRVTICVHCKGKGKIAFQSRLGSWTEGCPKCHGRGEIIEWVSLDEALKARDRQAWFGKDS